MADRFSAAVCMRGHYRETELELSIFTTLAPGSLERFCSECGAPVIKGCPKCGARLLGGYDGVVALGMEPEMFCFQCAAPYPWADRTAIVLHVRNQLEFEPGIDGADRLELIEQLAVLTEPEAEPKRRVKAGEAVKRLAPKGWQVVQPVLQSLLSAELRRQLGLPIA